MWRMASREIILARREPGGFARAEETGHNRAIWTKTFHNWSGLSSPGGRTKVRPWPPCLKENSQRAGGVISTAVAPRESRKLVPRSGQCRPYVCHVLRKHHLVYRNLTVKGGEKERIPAWQLVSKSTRETTWRRFKSLDCIETTTMLIQERIKIRIINTVANIFSETCILLNYCIIFYCIYRMIKSFTSSYKYCLIFIFNVRD